MLWFIVLATASTKLDSFEFGVVVVVLEVVIGERIVVELVVHGAGLVVVVVVVVPLVIARATERAVERA